MLGRSPAPGSDGDVLIRACLATLSGSSLPCRGITCVRKPLCRSLKRGEPACFSSTHLDLLRGVRPHIVVVGHTGSTPIPASVGTGRPRRNLAAHYRERRVEPTNVLWVTGDDCRAEPAGQQCHARVDDVRRVSQPT